MSNLHSNIISGSSTTISISNHNNNNNNSRSEQELISAKLDEQTANSNTRATSQQVVDLSSELQEPEHQYAALASGSQSHLSGALFAAPTLALTGAKPKQTSGSMSSKQSLELGKKQHLSQQQLQQHLQQQQHIRHYHQHAGSHQHLQQMSANLVGSSAAHQLHHQSASQLGHSAASTPPSPGSNKLIAGSKSASNLLQAPNRQSPPVDRSDSASLPSSTSTSESMFKRRLG